MWKILIVSAFFSAASAFGDDVDYLGTVPSLGLWRIGGQPAGADFEAMRESGVTTVINNRLPSELDQLDFDESQVATNAGLTYHHLPVGDDAHPYSPALLKAFADGLQSADGVVLIHCRSGRRSRTLLAAHLMRHRGLSIDKALETVGPAGIEIDEVHALLGRPESANVDPQA